MTKIRALVLTGYGLNCDHETAFALTMAGADAQRVHINDLIGGAVRLDDFQIMVFGGGFSWGDDHGAGVLQAVRMGVHLGDAIINFVDKGALVLGICNGFQTLVNIGLLPGFDGDYASRSVALCANDQGNFTDRWVNLHLAADSPCVFTQGLGPLSFPVRHGEGKFYAQSKIIDRLIADRQAVIFYADDQNRPAGGKYPENPNGSIKDIAGICDPTGRVFGLMPHPEAFLHWTNHPDWTRIREDRKRAGLDPFSKDVTPGVALFQNAVNFFR